MKPLDRDIIDFLMNDAPTAHDCRISQSAIDDPQVTARIAQWGEIIPAIEKEREANKALQQKVIDRVMLRLTEKKVQQIRSLPSIREKVNTAFFNPSWARVYVGASLACILLVIGYANLKGSSGKISDRISPIPSYSREAQQRNMAEVTTPVSNLRPRLVGSYVEFVSAGIGDGSAGNPYTTLAAGLMAERPGSTLTIFAGTTDEKLLIDKPVLLNAVGGSVRIGSKG